MTLSLKKRVLVFYLVLIFHETIPEQVFILGRSLADPDKSECKEPFFSLNAAMRGTQNLTECGSLFKLKLTLIFQEHLVMQTGTSTLTPLSCTEERRALP